MSSITFCNDSNKMVIDGCPDAVKAISLEGNLAKRLAELTLHLQDLTDAENYLRAANTISADPVVYRALAHSAVVTFMKCFGRSKARFSLDSQIFNKSGSTVLSSFLFFGNLRDKHIAHDENPFSMCLTFALINDGNKPYKVENVYAIAMAARFLDQEKLNELAGLIEIAKAWIQEQSTKLREKNKRRVGA